MTMGVYAPDSWRSRVAPVLARLEAHLVDADFRGYDPHDGLNSPLVRALTVGNRWLGVAALQFFKRSRVNLRPLFGVRPGINPKGWGLFAATYALRARRGGGGADLARARRFADWLVAHATPTASGIGWGYNFPWPNRNDYYPAGLPTIVNTAYVGGALLDVHALTGAARYADAARRAAAFVLGDLPRTGDAAAFCFGYTPRGITLIHNASLLGAALLARLHRFEAREEWRAASLAATRWSVERQRPDGSWWYGEEPRNRWIDSYHTGYNLLALREVREAFPDAGDEPALRRGYAFYLDHFFEPDGRVKYYHDRGFPYDAHAAAHALLTLHELRGLDPERSDALMRRVLSRAIELFWDERRGCFNYALTARGMNRIDYIRWVQAWMFYALTVVAGVGPEDPPVTE
jgi:hypothetical protein